MKIIQSGITHTFILLYHTSVRTREPFGAAHFKTLQLSVKSVKSSGRSSRRVSGSSTSLIK